LLESCNKIENIKHFFNVSKMADYSTPEGCLAAVQQYGTALLFVPDDKKTPEICLVAVQQHGTALEFVPDDKKTHEICLAAVQQYGCALTYVPYEKKTHEICLVAVQQRGYAILFVPDDKKTPEIFLAAVQQNGYVLMYVPAELQSDEIIQAALLQNPEAVIYIKKTIKIHHGAPKQMPEKAYDTLEMGYDEETAIQDGELMVDFHDEFTYGRYYRKATFEKFVLPSKKNPLTSEAITEYTIYQAKV
jgi:hypothetical protein